MKHRSVLTGFSRPYSNIQDTGCSWYSDSIKDKDLNGFALQLEPSFVDLMLRFELSKLSVAKFTLPRKLFAVQSCIRRRFAAGLMLRRHLQSFWNTALNSSEPYSQSRLCTEALPTWPASESLGGRVRQPVSTAIDFRMATQWGPDCTVDPLMTGALSREEQFACG